MSMRRDTTIQDSGQSIDTVSEERNITTVSRVLDFDLPASILQQVPHVISNCPSFSIGSPLSKLPIKSDDKIKDILKELDCPQLPVYRTTNSLEINAMHVLMNPEKGRYHPSKMNTKKHTKIQKKS